MSKLADLQQALIAVNGLLESILTSEEARRSLLPLKVQLEMDIAFLLEQERRKTPLAGQQCDTSRKTSRQRHQAVPYEAETYFGRR